MREKVSIMVDLALLAASNVMEKTAVTSPKGRIARKSKPLRSSHWADYRFTPSQIKSYREMLGPEASKVWSKVKPTSALPHGHSDPWRAQRSAGARRKVETGRRQQWSLKKLKARMAGKPLTVAELKKGPGPLSPSEVSKIYRSVSEGLPSPYGGRKRGRSRRTPKAPAAPQILAKAVPGYKLRGGKETAEYWRNLRKARLAGGGAVSGAFAKARAGEARAAMGLKPIRATGKGQVAGYKLRGEEGVLRTVRGQTPGEPVGTVVHKKRKVVVPPAKKVRTTKAQPKFIRATPPGGPKAVPGYLLRGDTGSTVAGGPRVLSGARYF